MAGHLEFGSELFQEYADADVFVLPSRSEGTPRVLVEARAFGCPVVATRVGGIPSSVAEGRDGLLVPPDDVTALADAILRVATEPGLRQSLSRSGRERVRSWTIDGLADALVEQAAAAVAEAR